jgi:hypothetical protein
MLRNSFLSPNFCEAAGAVFCFCPALFVHSSTQQAPRLSEVEGLRHTIEHCNDKTNFNVSLGALYDNGLMDQDKLSRYNGKMNIDHRINNMFKVGGSLMFSYKNNDKANSGVFAQALKMTTITHAYLSDGSINTTPNPWYAAHSNPLLDMVDGRFQHNIESTRFFGNAYVEFTP